MQPCIWTAQGTLRCDNVQENSSPSYQQYEDEDDYAYYDDGDYYEGFAVAGSNPKIPEGASIKCNGETNGKVYRYTNGAYRHYSNATIASSYNKDWGKNIMTVDCKSLVAGPPMPMLVKPAEGASIKCQQDAGTKNAGKVYRYVNGEYRHYPNTQIAKSWNKTWANNVTTIDCSPFKEGAPLSKFQRPPQGASIKCQQDTGNAAAKVYRHVSGEYRHYPNGQVAASWTKDNDWRKKITKIDCSPLTPGPQMQMYQPPAEGSSVRCVEDRHKKSKTVYRFTNGEIRGYPNPTVAKSWDPNWGKNTTEIECTNIKRGAPMKMYAPPPEGAPIKCKENMNSKTVYRYTNGQYKPYPSPKIAKSWDPNWSKNVTTVVCTPLKKGPAMALKK